MVNKVIEMIFCYSGLILWVCGFFTLLLGGDVFCLIFFEKRRVRRNKNKFKNVIVCKFECFLV